MNAWKRFSYWTCASLLIILSAAEGTGCKVEFSIDNPAQRSDYSIKSENTGTSLIHSSFDWEFVDSRLRSRNYRVTIELLEKDVREAAEYVEALSYMSGEELGIESYYSDYESVEYIHDYWELIYKKLYYHQYERFNRIVKGLNGIFQKENFRLRDKALFIITFIQNIEYKRPGGRLDLLAPTEALAEKFGDCDTKSLLLYIFLEKIGVDCVFFWSYQYKHAMLGVAASGAGRYKTAGGKKYYFLETTYPGWAIGQLPPEMDNPNYWYINNLDYDTSEKNGRQKAEPALLK